MGHPLVAFMGYARAGKDTACEQLGWPRAAMADQLKADLAPLFDRMGLTLAHDKAMLRPLMVEYGRLGRKISKDYWINRLVMPDGRCAICDVRYLSEVVWVQRHGGFVINIVRPEFGPANREEEESFAEIERARASRQVEFILDIQNDGTVDQLGIQVRTAVGHFFEARHGG